MAQRVFSLLLSAVLAGFCIGLGGSVFLRVRDTALGMPSVVLGALLFSVGLFTVCTRGYALYTGRVGYLFEQDNIPAYVGQLVVIWLGNFLGCALLGGLENLTGICGSSGINTAALGMVNAKLADSCLSLFWLGFLCNVFMFIAVNGYAKNPHQLGKYLAIFFGVVCFIVLGTEHSIADMYYFCVSGKVLSDPAGSLGVLAVVTLGNALGGVFLPLTERVLRRLGGQA